MAADNIYHDNSYEFEFAITKKIVQNGKVVRAPATGLSDVRGVVQATAEDAAAIDPALDVALVERAGVPGTYSAILTKAVVNAKLFGVTTFAGLPVFVGWRNADGEELSKVKCVAVRKV